MTCALVVAEPTDSAFLYHLAAEVEPAWLRVSAPGLPLPTHFTDVLTTGVARQYLIVDPADHLLGSCAVHSMSERHGNAWVEVVVSPDCGDHVTVERDAYDQLLAVAFGELGLRTVYVRCAEWAPAVISDRWNARTLGSLREALLHEGRHWAVSVLAVDAPPEGAHP